MKISYVVGTAEEGRKYIQPLLDRLLKFKKPEDQLLILDDFSQDEETVKVLDEYSDRVNIYQHALAGDFSAHRNYVHQFCTGDYIIMLDADEIISETFMYTIHEVLENNTSIDLFYMPRINIVHGITQDYVSQCGWRVNEQGYVNFPDQQGRIYRNSPEICWKNKIHEVISGTDTHATLPYEDENGKIVSEYAILHVKSMQRQQYQNEKYSKM